MPPFRARTFGFIFQDFNLIAALSARENVEVALNLAGGRGRRAAERRQLLESLGLADRLDFPVEKLSGGEKQRVAIARAIANRPTLILADEPTANLDSAHGAETMRLLRRLAKEEGTTVVIVSHDDRLREVADRVRGSRTALKALAALVRDPVCGMLLDPARRRGHRSRTASSSTSARAAATTSTSRSVPAPDGVSYCHIPAGISMGDPRREVTLEDLLGPGIHCGHCEAAVTRELGARQPGVHSSTLTSRRIKRRDGQAAMASTTLRCARRSMRPATTGRPPDGDRRADPRRPPRA